MTPRHPVELSPADLDLSPFVHAGDGVFWAQACAEPVVLVDAFLRLARDVRELSAFVGLSWRDLSAQIPDSLRVVSYGALGLLRRLSRLEVVPCHFSALPDLFARGLLPGDVAFIQVSPPDGDGRCSLGVSVDYLGDALAHAKVVIAEVNDQCPATTGSSISWDRLDVVVPTSRPLLEAPLSAPRPLEAQIAQNVAAIVADGDTVQLGVGALPEAIMSALSGHRNLGIHSGMVSDGILNLIECGAVTNDRKPIDLGVTVTGAALGSERLFAALRTRHDIRFMPVSYTHAPATLAQVGPLAAINSGLQIDLTGQVAAEAVGGRWLGAVGGQVDFFRAASAGGGKPILALPAARIVSGLHGPVSTARSDVDWVATEYGACSLRGLSESQRQRALLLLAGEERAEELRAECEHEARPIGGIGV